MADRMLSFYDQPLKLDLTEGFETSANHYMTPGKYPKEHIQLSAYVSRHMVLSLFNTLGDFCCSVFRVACCKFLLCKVQGILALTS
jgi:hypothetical protein